MKKAMLIFGLILAGLSAQAQEIVEAGIYEGKISAIRWDRDCRLELFRGEDGVLNIAGVRDSGNAYNLWSRDGSDFKLDSKTGAKVYTRSLRLSMVDAGGIRTYDSRTTTADARAYNDTGVLEVTTDAKGVATSYVFRFTSPTEKANIIQCNDLRVR